MKVLFFLSIFSLSNISFAQNYSLHLDVYDYLTCDELEREIVKKTELVKGWDDYELDSSFLEIIKIYTSNKSFSGGYEFALIKFKDNPNQYVYCGIDYTMFNLILETWRKTNQEVDFSKLFHEYISPYKCDCR